MATRRMFSKKIVNTARFLKMPVTTQLLYFHLGLNADDDGIVEGYNVMRMINCTEDDLKVLVAKEFVIVLNKDLVTYISDWTEHNQIRADRKVDSIYKDLLIKITPDGQPNVNQMSAECPHRLGKVRLGKVRLGKVRLGKVIKEEKTIKPDLKKPYGIIVNSWTTNPLFRTAINDFIDMRKAIKKPLTERALTLMLDKLNRLSNNDDGKIDILNQSVMSNYQGVFEVKGASTNGFKTNNKPDQGKWADYKPPKREHKPLTAKEVEDLHLI